MQLLNGQSLYAQEWTNIKKGFDWSCSNANKNERVRRLCSDYALFGNFIIDNNVSPRERIAWLTTASFCANSLGDISAESEHLGNLANAYLDLGLYRRAVRIYKRNLRLLDETDDSNKKAYVLANLGSALSSLERYNEAIKYLLTGEALSKATNNSLGLSTIYCNLGTIYHDIGEYQKAEYFYKETLHLSQMSNDTKGEGVAELNLGLLAFDQENFADALHYLENAVYIARSIKNSLTEGIALEGLANYWREIGEFDKALRCIRSSISIQEGGSHKTQIGHTYLIFGNICFDMEDYGQSCVHYKKSFEFSAGLKDREDCFNSSMNLANTYINLAQWDCALSWLRVGRKFVDPDDLEAQYGLHLDLGIVLQKMHRVESANSSFNFAIEFAIKMGDLDRENFARNILIL